MEVGRAPGGWTRRAALGLLVATTASPDLARADGFVVASSGMPRVRGVEAVLYHLGGEQISIERVQIDSSAERVGLLRVFRSPPTQIRASDPGLFVELEGGTRVEEPNYERVKARMFGPSIVTLLNARLATPKSRPRPSDPRPGSCGFDPEGDVATFVGPTETATGTKEKLLPGALRDALSSNGFEPGVEVTRYLVHELDAGATVILLTCDREGPQSSFTFGPIAYGFSAVEPTYPALALAPIVPNAKLVFYTLGPEPLVPSGPAIRLDDRPWEPKERDVREEPLLVGYHRPLSDAPRLGDALSAALGIELSPALRLVKNTLVATDRPTQALTFVPVLPTLEPLPPLRGRGTPFDWVLSILLGLTPLFYAPESWFLLWWSAQSRANERPRQPRSLAVYLWPLFALGVGAYWIATLEGNARVAGLLPLLIGAVRLLFPGARVESLYRVDFKKKKDKEKAAAPKPAARKG